MAVSNFTDKAHTEEVVRRLQDKLYADGYDLFFVVWRYTPETTFIPVVSVNAENSEEVNQVHEAAEEAVWFLGQQLKAGLWCPYGAGPAMSYGGNLMPRELAELVPRLHDAGWNVLATYCRANRREHGWDGYACVRPDDNAGVTLSHAWKDAKREVTMLWHGLVHDDK